MSWINDQNPHTETHIPPADLHPFASLESDPQPDKPRFEMAPSKVFGAIFGD